MEKWLLMDERPKAGLFQETPRPRALESCSLYSKARATAV